MRELDNVSISGTTIHQGILVFSNLLKKLKPGNAIMAELNDSRVINMGIEEVDENLDVYFYTGKGLRELFTPNQNDEERRKREKIKEKGKKYLIENSYYGIINMSQISQVK